MPIKAQKGDLVKIIDLAPIKKVSSRVKLTAQREYPVKKSTKTWISITDNSGELEILFPRTLKIIEDVNT